LSLTFSFSLVLTYPYHLISRAYVPLLPLVSLMLSCLSLTFLDPLTWFAFRASFV
jgi:hypothetical protein